MAQNFAFKLAENTPFLAIDGMNPELEIAKAQLAQKQANTPLTLGDRLFGREMTQDYQAVNPETKQLELTSLSNYKPGFFNDVAGGFRENYTQGFDVNNLAPQRKGLATRIGEGLGTLARFYDKPIGRMAVATGLSMLTGEANPLGEGVKAYVGRQTNMTRDKAYRQGLINMGVDEAQVNAIPGIMTDDIYKNLVDAKQAEIMANYRNDMLESTRENQGIMNQIRLDQLEETKAQHAYERMLAGQKLSLEEQRLALEWQKVQNEKDGKDKGKSFENPKIILNNVEELWKKMPQSKAIKGTSKAKAYQTGVGNMLGWNNNNVSAYMAISESMVTPLARQIAEEKGNVSDRDIARARNMLPQPTDSYEQGMAKIAAVKDLLNDLESRGENTNVATSNTTSNNATTQVGNYKVRVK